MNYIIKNLSIKSFPWEGGIRSLRRMTEGVVLVTLSMNMVTAHASETIGNITSSATYPRVCQVVGCSTYGQVNMRPTINANTTGATIITITDTSITGHAYGDQIGWIKFDPVATYMPSTMTPVKVNPTSGIVSGYAYANTGAWINFSPTTVSGGTAVGVTIKANGQWDGYAWVSGLNGGWLHFDCAVPATCVTTDWRPIPNRTVISGGGGGGGGGGLILTTPINGGGTSTPTQTVKPNYPATQINETTAMLRADINDDHVVGLFDYNLLMVNWSSSVAINSAVKPKSCAVSNIADVNCDGKVDLIDFNSVMVFWGKKI